MTNSDSTMITVDDLTDRVAAVFVAARTSAENARAVATALVEALGLRE